MHVNDETDNELDDSYEADGPSVRTFPSSHSRVVDTHQISGTDCADIASLSTNTCLSDAFGDREKNNHSGGYEGVRCSSAELGNNLARYWKKCYFREKSIREIRVVSRFTVLEIANGTVFFPI